MYSIYKRIIVALFLLVVPITLFSETFRYGPNIYKIIKPPVGQTMGEAELIKCDQAYATDQKVYGYALNGNQRYTVSSIGDGVFANQPGINTVTIYKPITKIGKKAFINCVNLRTLVLPKASNVEVDNEAFHGCSALESVANSDSIVTIGDAAFRNCTALKTFSFSKRLKSIGSEALRNCRSLTNISIPSTVEEIKDYAFLECNLQKVEYLTDEPLATSANVFSAEVYKNAVLTVAPGGYYNARETSPWENFSTICEKGQPVESIHINNVKINADIEEKVQLQATYYPVYADCPKISWRSSNRSVATVDANGLVTALRTGTAVITAYIGSVSASCELTVSEFPVDNIFLYNGLYYKITSRENLTAVVINPTAKKGSTLSYKGEINIPEHAMGFNKTFRVTSIYSNAFESCHDVTGIALPSSITSIGIEAFEGCNNLTHINIPPSINEIGRSAFKECSSLRHIDLPETITVLHENTFMNSGLESVSVPGSIIRLENGVFAYCGNLKEIIFPDNCESIGSWILDGCSSLTELVIPPTVKQIAVAAFYSVPNLQSITYLTSQPLDVEGSIFDCETYENATLYIKEDALAAFKASWYWGQFENYASKGVRTSEVAIDRKNIALNITKTFQLHSATYPELCEDKRVTWSSEDSNIATVSPSGLVTAVNSGTVNIIASCAGVTDTCVVTVKEKTYDFLVDDIAYNVISEDAHTVEVAYYEEYEQDIVIPQTVKYNNKTYTVTALTPGAFKNLCYVLSVELPETITTISKEAFYNCINLRSVTLGSNTNVFEEAAFKLSNALRSISFRKTNSEQKTLAAGAVNSHGWIGKEAFDNCCALENFEMPASIVEIGDRAFFQCFSLKNIKLAPQFSSIGNEAFAGCIHVTSIKLPEHINSIGEKVFMGCSSLTDVTLPSNLTKITTSMFEYCETLTNVNFPTSLSEIEDRAFYMCSNLASIQLPSQLHSIGELAFTFCKKVTSLPLPESLKSIGRGAFFNCQQVKDIHIPAQIESIGDGAFMTLSQIEKIEYLSAQPLVNKTKGSSYYGPEFGIFSEETYNDATLVVNVNERIPLMQTNTWGKFKHIVENGTLVSSITLTPDEWEGSAGDEFNISASVYPSYASNPSVTYTSSDEDVATVDDAGNVTIVNDGTCTITVEAADGSEVKAECQIYCATAAETIPTDLINSTIDVYDLKGQELLRNADSALLKSLTPGTYIIDNNGKRSKLFLR